MSDELMEHELDQSLGQEPQAADIVSEERLVQQSQRARRECVQKYLEHSLTQKDPLRAGFGAINADLMAVAQPIADLLKRGLSSPSLTIDSAQKLMPVMDTYYRLTRMIERFGQLDVRIASERRNRKELRQATPKPR